MEGIVFLLFVGKVGMSIDLIINGLLCIVLGRTENRYYSDQIELAPKIILAGTVAHLLFFHGFKFIYSSTAWEGARIIMYLPYLLLSAYIVFLGYHLFKNEARVFSILTILHGLISFFVCFYMVFIFTGTGM